MQVVITEWGLQAYLSLLQANMFTRQEYKATIRPDVERLKTFPSDPEFANPHFWGPATDRSGNAVSDGYKMKWHNIGPGRVQLRLSVAVLPSCAFLCNAYSKTSDAQDKREAAKLKNHIRDIRLARFQVRGVLP